MKKTTLILLGIIIAVVLMAKTANADTDYCRSDCNEALGRCVSVTILQSCGTTNILECAVDSQGKFVAREALNRGMRTCRQRADLCKAECYQSDRDR